MLGDGRVLMVTRRRALLFAGAGLAAWSRLDASGVEFWEKKPPAEWTSEEIDRLIDDFVATAQELQRTRPGLQVIVSVASTVALDSARCPFRLVHSASLSVLRAADAALCKSGTTTLEAAIADCPLVVAYRTGRVSYALAKRAVKIPHIGLVNVVAGREVAREFIQDDIVPGTIAQEMLGLLEPGSRQRQEVLAGLAEVRSKLGTPGAAERVARMASDLVGAHG